MFLQELTNHQNIIRYAFTALTNIAPLAIFEGGLPRGRKSDLTQVHGVDRAGC